MAAMAATAATAVSGKALAAGSLSNEFCAPADTTVLDADEFARNLLD